MSMNQLKEQYSELIALTELFLLREYPLKDKLMTDPHTHAFFQKLVKPLISDSTKTASVLPIATYSPDPQPIKPEPPPNPKPEPFPAEPPKPVKPEPPPGPSIPDPNPPTIVTRAEQKKPTTISLEPLSAPTPSDYQEFRPILKEYFPQYPLSDQIPSDQLAKKIKNTWQVELTIPPIIILSFHEQEKQLNFLRNIAQAITHYLAPARVLSSIKIEQEKKWSQILETPGIRLIIASDYSLYLLPELMKHYREVPKQAKHFLHQTPLLLLSDLSLYLKEPQLKSLLWRAICTEFEASKTR